MARRRRRGFTLVELMAVVVIIGLLATAATVAVQRHAIDAKHSRVAVDMQTIVNAAKMYRLKRGQPPRGLEDLCQGEEAQLEALPLDPWGRAYGFEVVGAKVEVTTLGADGETGGEGEDRDLRSSEVLAPRPR